MASHPQLLPYGQITITNDISAVSASRTLCQCNTSRTMRQMDHSAQLINHFGESSPNPTAMVNSESKSWAQELMYSQISANVHYS